MPIPSLAVDRDEFHSQSIRLDSLLSSLSTLHIRHRKLVAEIVMIRLFLLVENTIQSVCAKLLCGATYLDGSQPQCLIKARSSFHAYELMRAHARPKPKRDLKWNKSTDIRDNLETTLAITDPIFITVVNFGVLLTDMRYVRNHIAHSNRNTRKNFRKLIQKHYGGVKNGMTPGVLLLTSSLGPPPLLKQYLLESRVLIKSLVRE